jgi:Monooxygenase af470-like
MAKRRTGVGRQTVDLSAFPDLVVIYLGMRVRNLRGLGKLLQTGRQIRAGVAQGADGLLLHENIVFSFLPPHLGMRQYWRDFDALERWTRELPHQQWWKDFLRDSAGTGFWHETYFMRGGMEGIYDDMAKPIGMMSFAPLENARGRMFSARSRLGQGEPRVSPVISEDALTDSTELPLDVARGREQVVS